MSIHKKLSEIQQKLKAPKGQYNAFGKYKYRSCEDILTAVKPLLSECSLTISDDILLVGDRYYVVATAKLSLEDQSVKVTAMAREQDIKKGMDSAQVTGAASSYARKYSLNGLFAIDDTRDADSENNQEKAPIKNGDAKKESQTKADLTKKITMLCAEITSHMTKDEKIQWLKDTLLIDNFNRLQSKTSKELQEIVKKLESIKQSPQVIK